MHATCTEGNIDDKAEQEEEETDENDEDNEEKEEDEYVDDEEKKAHEGNTDDDDDEEDRGSTDNKECEDDVAVGEAASCMVSWWVFDCCSCCKITRRRGDNHAHAESCDKCNWYMLLAVRGTGNGEEHALHGEVKVGQEGGGLELAEAGEFKGEGAGIASKDEGGVVEHEETEGGRLEFTEAAD